jgi:hypothetical protein
MSEREEHSSSASFELLDLHPAAAFRRHYHPNQATQITDEVMGDICLGFSEDRHEEEEEDKEEDGTNEGNPQGQVAEGDELHLLEAQHRSLIPYPRMIANQDGIPREAPKKKKKKRHRDLQWLLDRVHGDSKFNETKPPCFICYVPLPIKWWPNLMETNAAFEAMGKVGIFHPNNQKARSILIGFGLLSNILGVSLPGGLGLFLLPSLAIYEADANPSLCPDNVGHLYPCWRHYGLRYLAGIIFSSRDHSH